MNTTLKYVKKPVIVEAIQLKKDNIVDVLKFLGQNIMCSCHLAHDRLDDYCNYIIINGLEIHTLEGDMLAREGDYIIKGIKGEFYPCKPDIFEASYQLLKEDKR